VGVIGCGTISGQYFRGLSNHEGLHVAACSDIVMDRAVRAAEEFALPKACSVDDLLSDPEIDLAVNLTAPLAHAQVSLAAIRAGKHLYSEKPLAVEREDGEAIVRAAADQHVMVGCAPDTFLGGGIQTCRSLIDQGAIGRPIAATAFMLNHGHERWHPAPQFYYKQGGGPMFDMGPYYLTALVCLLGPVRRVSGAHGRGYDTRTITSQPLQGESVDVEVSTHVAGTMDFESGVIATIVTSFDVPATRLTHVLEVYGTEGTLSVPDPNTFGGPVMVRRRDDDEWKETPLAHGAGGRGLGVADMAGALRHKRRPRVHASLANHVLDVMHSFHDSSDTGRHIPLRTTCERPAPLLTDGVGGLFD
jgi:predicted dehydrogenase